MRVFIINSSTDPDASPTPIDDGSAFVLSYPTSGTQELDIIAIVFAFDSGQLLLLQNATTGKGFFRLTAYTTTGDRHCSVNIKSHMDLPRIHTKENTVRLSIGPFFGFTINGGIFKHEAFIAKPNFALKSIKFSTERKDTLVGAIPLKVAVFQGEDDNSGTGCMDEPAIRYEQNLLGRPTGVSAAGIPPSIDVHPPDYDAFHYATSTAWPRAVDIILRVQQVQNTIKIRHRQLMGGWVTTRGDDLSPDAYDYLVYSHGVGWPKAIAESVPDNTFLQVRKRFLAIMEVSDHKI